jgi:hypothetical protein
LGASISIAGFFSINRLFWQTNLKNAFIAESFLDFAAEEFLLSLET